MSRVDPLLERLSRVAEAASGDDHRAATFARGLVLGALVGAAIAGSTIWQRRQAGVGGQRLSEPKPAIPANADAERGTTSPPQP